jgi:putative zinc finger/helix-turn-helix YgiT family protein
MAYEIATQTNHHMNTKIECPYCDGTALLRYEDREILYKKEPFQVKAHFYQCEKCREEFTTTESDTLTMVQVHNLYREKHGIPFPDEIASIRETYGLSAAAMSEVLGLGVNGCNNYERGEIPTSAIGNLILSASNPWVFRDMLMKSRDTMSENIFNRTMAQVEAQIERKSNPLPFYSKIDLHSRPSALTGYRVPNIEKVKTLFTCFISRCNRVLNDRLKINKLMFYADFLHYRQTGFSISGLSYRAINFGPVPSCYDNLFALLESEGVIFADWQQINDTIAREIFFVTQPVAPHVLEPSEIALVDKLCNQFAETTSWDMVEMSHREDAWQQLNERREIISYQEYAFGVKSFQFDS